MGVEEIIGVIGVFIAALFLVWIMYFGGLETVVCSWLDLQSLSTCS